MPPTHRSLEQKCQQPKQRPADRYLPGTCIPANLSPDTPDAAGRIFDSLFAGGGLVLSQVSLLSGMEPHSVQNWIKRGFCAPPKKKKYSRSQFCRLVLINMLKDSLSIPEIASLLSYINGDLQDEGDDTLPDDRLYLLLVRVILLAGPYSAANAEAAVDTVLEDVALPTADAALRVRRTLRTMLCAYHASLLRKDAAALLKACQSA